jgi:biopolymer transport protein ExbD
MDERLQVRIGDDGTICIDGRTLAGNAELVDALRSALRENPDVTLVIESVEAGHYVGVARVIDASRRAGVPVENLRYAAAAGPAARR